jgi:murein endopeptidase
MFTELPKSAPGLLMNNRTADSHFGKPSVIEALLRAGRLWQSRYPASKISVGHLSRKNGGPFPPHKSHRAGLDVDVRPMRSDLKNLPVTCNDRINYNRDLTRKLIQELRASAKVKLVLFNDPVLVAEGLTQSFPGHENHLHFRFAY